MKDVRPVKHCRIWLQIDEPEVSWCQDRIHDSDIEYVAVAVVREMVEKVKFEERCVVDPGEDDRDDFHEGWNAALDAVLAQLEGKP